METPLEEEVIDVDYRGDTKVILFNLTNCEYRVGVSARITQMICQEVSTPMV